jgi:hypothetical protein
LLTRQTGSKANKYEAEEARKINALMPMNLDN